MIQKSTTARDIWISCIRVYGSEIQEIFKRLEINTEFIKL